MDSIHDKTLLTKHNMSQMHSVYVCTFCQVFSSTVSTVVHHINSSHSELLPSGTTAENFVSKLNALQNGSNKKRVQKTQNPKKSLCEYAPEEEKMESKRSIPVPKSDGLFWCEKCHKCFNKARQLVKHVCMDTEEEDNDFEDTSVDSDVTKNYKEYLTIDPVPWSKRAKYKKAEDINSHWSEEGEDQNENKSVNIASQNSLINWRVDPSYLPVFQTEEEKTKFEKHLKSIDYSFVDILFDKRESSVSSSSVYFCKKCKKTAKSLSHMRLHCLIHTDIKPFTCPNCPYETNSKGSLYIHMRKHTGNMFCCSYCDFKSNKKVHVLDHEATHSTVPQICKLCKNTYKTLRSLIAHVKKYHNNLGGKSYIKSLSPGRNKVTAIHCSICHKKFTSLSTFENHSQKFHVPVTNLQPTDSTKSNANEVISEKTSCESAGDVQLQESPCLSSPSKRLECESVLSTKDSLAELVFRNFFEQTQSKPIIFNGSCDEFELKKMFAATVLLDALETESISDQLALLSGANQFGEPKQPNIEECEKTLSILDECLRSPNFEKQCLGVNFEEPALRAECRQEFQLPSVQPILPSETALQNQEVETVESNSNNLSELDCSVENERDENKSAEIKLFEKCHRAPAYVCCVCSAIFICSSTLKVHLKDHIDNSNSNLIEQEEDFTSKISDACSDLSNVCPMLIEPTSSYSEGEKELEKLYTSSMDMIWYLPEVSVVLENDPALFDSVLDDISNFPISDKYDEEDINVKSSENSVLECFNEL